MFECVCNDYDEDGPEFFVEKIVKARKQHVCCECEKDIIPGKKYETASGKWDGSFETYKTCLICAAIREDFMSCGSTFGMLWQDLQNAWGDDADLLGV